MMSDISGRLKKNYAIRILGLLGIIAVLSGVLFLLPKQATHAVGNTSSDTSTYMGDLGRSGFNRTETILNTTSAPTLAKLWQYPQPGAPAIGSIDVQPVIVGGILYWGSWNGYEHAMRLDGTQLWQAYIGKTTSAPTCTPVNAGPSGTATVTTATINGVSRLVVFVPGGDDKFYALDASSGSILWSTSLGQQPNYMLWAGAAVYNGYVYVGISSYGDCPLTPSHLFQLNASTGAIVHTLNTTPNNCPGAGIWNQPAIDTATNMLYITTGTVSNCNPPENLAYSILKVDATSLALVDSWQIPQPWNGDSDFGSTPTLFTATINGTLRQLVGAVNKNGWYYALDRNNLKAGPVWQKQVSTPAPNDKSSISTSAWDGTRLYEENSNTVLRNGQTCAGSVRAMDPATGNYLWEYCASGRSIGGVTVTPTVVVAQSGADVDILNSATGQQLAKFTDSSSSLSWFWGTPTVYNGIIYTGNKDGNFYALSVQGGSTTGPTATPTMQQTPPTTPPGPTAKTWYFAEGRVGAGFREYLTIDNSSTVACAANVKYLYTVEGTTTPSTRTVVVSVPASSRATEPVNQDLQITDSTNPAAAVAAIVTVDASTPNCPGLVVERPVYFTNYHGISSGTDELGITSPGTNFSFADVPSGSGYTSYLTILNPSTATANVTVTYYANGNVAGTQTLSVAATSRGTIAPASLTPTLPTHTSAVVTSTQPIVVERPTYVSNVNGMSGAADVVGTQTMAKDVLFAEGYAATTSQETLTIANVDPANVSAPVTITLKSKDGHTQAYNVTVAAHSQLQWNVNANNTFAGASPEVSAEIVSTGASLVVQREMFYQYHHTLSNGTVQTHSFTDVVGLPATSIRSAYSFAEGYTNNNYHEWLTLQNATANTETIYITVMNNSGKSTEQQVQVVANSRATVDITALVQLMLARPGDVSGNEVALTIQTLNNGGAFVAERPEYFNTFGTSYPVAGGTDIIGYGG